MTAVWCAIPVYNNARTILEIARRCREQLDHVIVIDDGSTDADLTQLLKSLDVTVLRHPTNRGKGQALLTAFRFAAERGAQYLLTLDGDGQHFPEDIPAFIPQLWPDRILIGYRKFVTGEMPRSSRFGREFSDFWITTQAGGNAKDTQSGFRAYPLAAILQLRIESRFYNFEMEIITRALWAGLKTVSIPIHVYYPPKDQSQSSFHAFNDNLRISLLHTKLILRQLLPIPHSQISKLKSKFSIQQFVFVNSTPLGLAFAAALSLIMSIVLWPFGFLAVAYIATRLHFNKIIALICILSCIAPQIAHLCQSIGKRMLPASHPTFQWILGSHVVALPVAFAAALILYFLSIIFYRRDAETQRTPAIPEAG